MEFKYIITELVLIYAGAAILATVFVFFRQPIILSYILLGAIIGPYGLAIINNSDKIEKISHIGIILLMFLIGLNLHPNKLIQLFKKTAGVTLGTSALFALSTGLVTYFFGFSFIEASIVGLSFMFSSTIVGLKLVPTTALHHKHIGEVMISVLLFQDILAIITIIFIGSTPDMEIYYYLPFLLVKGFALTAGAALFVKYCLLKLFMKYDVIQEYTLIIALGWCLGTAELAKVLGFSHEIGAFIAGCTLAISPIALFIAEKLKSLREFFLILFFFAVGAQFDISVLPDVLLPSIVLSVVILLIKPYLFSKAFKLSGEREAMGHQLSFRLGQASEFSLLLGYTALTAGLISNKASYTIQLTVIITFIFSTYYVTNNFPTPISSNVKRRKD